MSTFIVALTHVPPVKFSTPWMPLGRWLTDTPAHHFSDPWMNPISMSPE